MITALIVVLSLLLYAWIVYPVVMLGLGRRRVAAHSAPPTGREGELPSVAILFSAHNEAAVILKRLENLAALDYPADKLQVFAGIDGGSDNTAEITLAWAQSHPNVHVVVSETNHGKTAMLKRLVKAVEEGRIRTSNIEHSTLNIEQGGEKQANTPHLNPLPQGERKDENLLPLPLGERAGVRVGLERAGVRGSSSLDVECSLLNVQRSLLVFTDANTFFAPDALRNLVAPFVDPKVGGVCGRLNFVGGEKSIEQKSQRAQRKENCISAGGGKENSAFASFATSVQISSSDTDEPVYWNLETSLKSAESSLDSCLGANGAIYAMRPELFWAEIPDNTIIDDFVLGMKVREQGFRMVFEPTAVATEDLPATVPDEWRRRVRIGAGAFQALTLCRACLSPRHGRFALFFWSHKVLRWFTPHLAVGGVLLSCYVVMLPPAEKVVGCQVDKLLGGNPKVSQFSALNNQQLNNPTTLSSHPLTTQQLNNSTTLYMLAGILLLVLITPPGRKALKLLVYFVTMQAALFVGFLKYCKGGLKGTWERTERG